MESNSIITNSVYEGVNRKKPIRRVKPLKCYNKGQPLPKVEPTVAPVINTSEVVKSSMTLLKGDCLEVMKGLPDKSVDLIICDLPYGCLAQQKGVIPFGRNVKGPSNSGCSWDIKLNLEVFWKEVKRIRRDDHTPCIHFCNTKFGYDLIKSNEKEFRYDLVWDKQRGVSFLSANKMPMKSHEMIYVFSKLGANYNRIDIEGDYTGWKANKTDKIISVYSSGMPNGWKDNGNDGTKRCVLSVINDMGLVNCRTYNRGKPIQRTNNTVEDKRCVTSVIKEHNSASKGKHPTEKPLDLYKFLIERYSNAGDIVLDPTFGSCNSGFACKELNRKFIGIEKNDAFFWKGMSR